MCFCKPMLCIKSWKVRKKGSWNLNVPFSLEKESWCFRLTHGQPQPWNEFPKPSDLHCVMNEIDLACSLGLSENIRILGDWGVQQTLHFPMDNSPKENISVFVCLFVPVVCAVDWWVSNIDLYCFSLTLPTWRQKTWEEN